MQAAHVPFAYLYAIVKYAILNNCLSISLHHFQIDTMLQQHWLWRRFVRMPLTPLCRV